MTHRVQKREYISAPQDLRNGIDLFWKGAGEPGTVWPLRPFQIVSLLDMRPLLAWLLGNNFDELRNKGNQLASLCESRGPKETLTESETQELQNALVWLEQPCREAHFDRALERFARLRSLQNNPDAFDLETLKWEVQEILGAVIYECVHRKFFVLNAGDEKHFNLKHPFGEAVYNAFESARHDSREAKNCYVLDRTTACVFHCMRVVEKGLHSLVHHLNNTHSAGITFSKTVEETNWGNIIDEIQIALENPKRIRRLNPIPDKDQMRFYSTISLEFDYFKNAWRDDVSHSRKSYDRTSAKSVMDHVENFMRKIAKGGLKE